MRYWLTIEGPRSVVQRTETYRNSLPERYPHLHVPPSFRAGLLSASRHAFTLISKINEGRQRNAKTG